MNLVDLGRDRACGGALVVEGRHCGIRDFLILFDGAPAGSKRTNDRLGVQMIGNDAMNTPPAHSLSRRGIVGNARGYMLYGNYETPNPPAAIIHAVESDAIDVALVWGPLAGYFSRRSPVALRLETITPALDNGAFPMAYDISIGVRRDSPALIAAVDAVIEDERPAIAAILAAYAVPMVPREF